MFSLWWRISLLGLIGTASLILMPLELIVPLDMDPMLLRLAATVQPALLTLAFAWVGAWASRKVGLNAPAIRAWSEGRPILPELRKQLWPALAAGSAVAIILLCYVAIIRQSEIGAQLLRFTAPLPTRLLYGGITEELLMRWGLMSFLVWAAWRAIGRPTKVPAWCYWAGVALAALLFGIGHLPALSLLAPNAPDWLIGLVLVCNIIPGLLFGWLFWRWGLEAAMMAHAFAHLGAWAALLAL